MDPVGGSHREVRQDDAAFDVLEPLDDVLDVDPDVLPELDELPEPDEPESDDELDVELDDDSDEPDFTLLFVDVARESVR